MFNLEALEIIDDDGAEVLELCLVLGGGLLQAAGNRRHFLLIQTNLNYVLVATVNYLRYFAQKCT